MEERVLYGYMDGDYLQCIEIAPIPQKIRNEKTGEITTRMVSVIEQVAELPTIYKPVDAIDESKQNTDKEGYVVRIVPYDAGDRISFRYIEVPDFQKVAHEIERSKEVLASSDYKIIKCYEAALMGYAMPYEIKALHNERQLLRDKINELEARYTSLSDDIF